MLNLQNKNCLVVGGGRVGIRKVIGLLRAGSHVTVISTDFNKHFQRISSNISLIKRPFSENDIRPGITLVIGATNDIQVNRLISQKSASLGIPCNIVDCPELCSFIVPAVIRRGELNIAVSTAGASPRFSRYVKNRIALSFGNEFKQLADYFSDIRKRVRIDITLPSDRFLFWETIFDTDPISYIHQNGWIEFCNRTETLLEKFKQKAGNS